MSARGWKLIATDEPTVIAEPFPYTIVVEDRESNRSFPDPPGANKSDGFQVFGETNDFLNQPVTSETGSG